MDVSIIIVSYNTAELLKNCLASVYKHTKDIDFEIIVSDNDSKDNTLQMLKKEFPEAIVIDNKKNLGFAFINFIDSHNLANFYLKFHHKFNGITNSKTCRKFYEVYYCNTQGYDKFKFCYCDRYLYFNHINK